MRAAEKLERLTHQHARLENEGHCPEGRGRADPVSAAVACADCVDDARDPRTSLTTRTCCSMCAVRARASVSGAMASPVQRLVDQDEDEVLVEEVDFLDPAVHVMVGFARELRVDSLTCRCGGRVWWKWACCEGGFMEGAS